MVKCIKNCLKFLNFFQKPSSDGKDSKVLEISINQNAEALNMTSLQEKDSNPDENQIIQTSIKLSYRARFESSPSKLLASCQNSPEKASVIISECNLSPISKRSHSEDFSPVKIPSPTLTSRVIPNVFFTEKPSSKPKVYASTPRIGLPRSLKRIMCPIQVS
jgi:hypothetical protein